MCDLWKNTLSGTVSDGAIPRQISFALRQLPPATCVKLYNSGSFFDPHAIPPTDHQEIADRVADYDRVIVESHPALIGEASLRFRDLLKGKLEVAMGLETVHPVGLEKLNKRLSVSQFAHAASYLREHGIGLRAFVLVHPPFVALDDAVYWDQRSIDFAFQSGADTVSLILTRAGNGAMDRLIESGDFTPPPLDALEAALDYGIRLGRGRVFADLWDLSSSLRCEACASSRINRLRRVNDTQLLLRPPTCPQSGGSR
jgi:radical SAM enzyme (TIGR01210 family)